MAKPNLEAKVTFDINSKEIQEYLEKALEEQETFLRTEFGMMMDGKILIPHAITPMIHILLRQIKDSNIESIQIGNVDYPIESIVNLIQKSLGPDPSSTLPMEIKSRR